MKSRAERIIDLDDDTVFNRCDNSANDELMSARVFIQGLTGEQPYTYSQDILKLEFNMSFYEDGERTGVVEECFLVIRRANKQSEILRFGEIDPEDLYWAGKAFMNIAKHHGVTKRSLDKANREEITKATS